MNLRQEWMSDEQYFDSDYPNNKILAEVTERFETQKNSLEGKDAIIDGVAERVVIQNHTNPLNQNKYDLKIHCSVNSEIHTGSMVELEDKTWLVVSKILNNKAYKTASLLQTNNTLKFYNKNGILKTLDCIVSTGSKNYIDESTNRFLTSPNSKYLCTIPDQGDFTKSDVDLRFMINGGVYELVGTIDNITAKGLIYMEWRDGIPIADDNKDLNIANYYSNQPKPTDSSNGTLTVSLTPSNTTLILGRTLELTAQAFNNGVEDLTRYYLFTVTNDDGTSNNYITTDIRSNSCKIIANNVSSNAGKFINVHVEILGYSSVFYNRQIKLVNF